MPLFGSSRIIGLDIGDASVEAALVDVSGKQPVWLSRARVELPPGLIERGIVRDAKAVADAIRGMVAAGTPRPFGTRDVIVNVPDQQSVSRLLPLTRPTPRERLLPVVSQDAAGFVPYPLEDVRVDYAPVTHGKTHEVFYAAAPEVVLKNIEAVVTAAGLTLGAYDLETLALARLFSGADADGAQLILDVGAETTTLSIVDAEGLRRSAVLDFGGAHLTQSLAAKEQLPADKAELLKRKAGYSPDVAGGKIFFVLQKSTQDLIAEVRRSVDEYERSVGVKVAQLTVAGGASLTPHMTEYLGGALGIPARQGDPVALGLVGVPEAVPREDAVLHANALGLALAARDGRLPHLNFQRKERIIRQQPAPIGGIVEEGTPQPPHPTPGAKKRVLSKRTRIIIAVAVAIAGVAAIAGSLVYAFVIRPSQGAPEAGADLPDALEVSFETPFRIGGDLQEGELALTVLTADLEARRDVPVSGGAEVAELATGTMAIINDGDTPQALVERTRLLSSEGVLFRLRNGVTVPPRGRVDAEVIADQPGAAGNVPAGRFTIPGLPADRQGVVYGDAAAPMTGGVRQTGQVSDADIQRALTEAREDLSARALTAWREALAPGHILLAEPLAVRITRSVIPEPGQRAGAAVDITATVVGATAPEDALRSLADAAATADTGADAAGAYLYASWQLTVISYDDAAGTGQLAVRAAAERQ